ncbi:hypothetical protein AB0K09_19435 [Streptomyces sp. NPDC049577]|uniref:hypothetical protein n=1 Tax=Streptomyces sp. NPDC049577 TaxID=3155153 RepID=UPI00342E6E6D
MPPLGTLVYDAESGRDGILMHAGEHEDPYTRRKAIVAFLRWERGGREWTTNPANVSPVPLPAGRRARKP